MQQMEPDVILQHFGHQSINCIPRLIPPRAVASSISSSAHSWSSDDNVRTTLSIWPRIFFTLLSNLICAVFMRHQPPLDYPTGVYDLLSAVPRKHP